MPNSLRSKLSKLRYKRQISDEEYRELIAKLDGHDKELLDKIRAEIEELIEWHDCPVELDGGNDLWFCEACKRAIEIIDKYKAERSGEDADSD